MISSPLLFHGAIVAVNKLGPPKVLVFQYNPDTLTRTLNARAVDNGGGAGEVLRLKGPPEESIKLDVEVDATDQLERGSTLAAGMGIYPALAALETLLYPESQRVIANEALLRLGMLEIIPPEAPLTLFVWGARRILPVRITELSITEEAFDTALNPIRAKVSLGLRVLSYHDFGLASAGGALFMSHQIMKEVMAKLAATTELPSGIRL